MTDVNDRYMALYVSKQMSKALKPFFGLPSNEQVLTDIRQHLESLLRTLEAQGIFSEQQKPAFGVTLEGPHIVLTALNESARQVLCRLPGWVKT